MVASAGAGAWAARALSMPLLPADYLALVIPAWSGERRGRIVAVDREAHDIVTVRIRPSVRLPLHRPGQYLPLAIEMNGRRHWRAYTLTSDPGDPIVSVTVKRVAGGVVSDQLVSRAHAGDLVYLGEIGGEFVMPQRLPERILMISAGSGITPIIALLRELERARSLVDVTHVACVRAARDFAFGNELDSLAVRHTGYRLHVHFSSQRGRLTPPAIDSLCPDWQQRRTFACGPEALLDALEEYWAEAGLTERLSTERFRPSRAQANGGDGGRVRFRLSGVEADCAGGATMLAAGLAAGARLPYGCTVGICRTCVGALADGCVRDLRTGTLCAERGAMVRTCISCAEGSVEIDL